MIKAILFDFGQTLVNSAEGFKQAEKAAQRWIRSDLFITEDDPQSLVFIDTYRRIRKEFHDQSIFSRPAIWAQVFHHFNRAADPVRFEKKEYQYWETVKAHTRPFPETLPILQQLADSYPLALITNTQGQKKTGTHRIALFPEVERFFKTIIVAGESGIPAKPDKAPFLSGVKKLGVAPGQAVYVGDDWRIDIQGSQAAGLHPVWLKHHLVHRNWPKVESIVPIIIGLNQLPELLKLLNEKPAIV
jgi:putative hydrolase of the HAD superfamily